MSWTDERVELLKKLWSEGLSASQIAGRLGSVTRNAVIGKVHRLGLSGRATTSRMKTHRPRTRMANAKRPVKPRFAQAGNPAVRALYMDTEAYVPPAEEIEIPAGRAQIDPDADRLQLPLADWRSADGGLPFLRAQQGTASALLRSSCPARLPTGRTAPSRTHRGRNSGRASHHIGRTGNRVGFEVAALIFLAGLGGLARETRESRRSAGGLPAFLYAIAAGLTHFTGSCGQGRAS